ncbi:unnamed protein product [Pleuronectes platessa]|uniref:Uncharacterized protein n=1 Tax=Pleuronectes platessa TaxID=8262 RepID=A0A9N7Z765_PLEPL|nr:unnamed protein product [Pleuronectes platessa]
MFPVHIFASCGKADQDRGFELSSTPAERPPSDQKVDAESLLWVGIATLLSDGAEVQPVHPVHMDDPPRQMSTDARFQSSRTKRELVQASGVISWYLMNHTHLHLSTQPFRPSRLHTDTGKQMFGKEQSTGCQVAQHRVCVCAPCQLRLPASLNLEFGKCSSCMQLERTPDELYGHTSLLLRTNLTQTISCCVLHMRREDSQQPDLRSAALRIGLTAARLVWIKIEELRHDVDRLGSSTCVRPCICTGSDKEEK